MNFIKKHYSYATHPERMEYKPQELIDGIIPKGALASSESQNSSQNTVVSLDTYIKDMYPYATHPERLACRPQTLIGGIVPQGALAKESLNQVGSALSNSSDNYVKDMYPYATHPERLAYRPQTLIGGIVPQGALAKESFNNNIVELSANDAIDTQNINIENQATQIDLSSFEPPLDGSIIYAGVSASGKSSTAKAGTASKKAAKPKFERIEKIISNEIPADAMKFDIIVVGAGPSGLSTAIRAKQKANKQGKDVSVCVIEKGASVGDHILSGAVLEPRALNELLPNWEELGAPLDTPARSDDFLFLTKNSSIKMPTPKQMHNHGNYIISLGKFARWLGKQAEELGVEIFTGTTVTSVIKDSHGSVIGVKTGDFGVDKDGNKTDNFTSGSEMYAHYTVFAEGCRGSITKKLFADYNLREGCDPQTYGIGIKEYWEIDPSKSNPGKIIHTTGWPLDTETYGGSFLYHLNDNKVAIGFVVGLDYKNPHLFPYMEFQRFKHHPDIKKYLEGGKRISYGARAINEGGFQSIPKLYFSGGLLVGCTAGFLNVPKIKGTHTSMKSGMIAAEAMVEELISTSEVPNKLLEKYSNMVKDSWIWNELKEVRNIRPSFHKFGFWGGMFYSALTTYVFRGKEPWTFRHEPDFAQLKKASECKKIDYPKPDGVISFDRLTNVAFSGTQHSANQPVHLQLIDNSIPVKVNLAEYDMPETRYCPAGVYELSSDDKGDPCLQINAQNCVHCKTCDIKDPTQNINWVTPEGGDGPNYESM